jgi:hypothetical protein
VEIPQLSQEWKILFEKMISHFSEQLQQIHDETLEKELKRLEDLANKIK